ncbi:AGAP001892-PA-like protein [Anopheles sinensis]|uniref:AGAP001892-PA-like protein n=1 Tax=Anopheles sinensis TaxID=74873 RepID=A0A084VRX0_ANOSI|nr:AGAP001892-PA-like protein [Anopheles sinensis]
MVAEVRCLGLSAGEQVTFDQFLVIPERLPSNSAQCPLLTLDYKDQGLIGDDSDSTAGST